MFNECKYNYKIKWYMQEHIHNNSENKLIVYNVVLLSGLHYNKSCELNTWIHIIYADKRACLRLDLCDKANTRDVQKNLNVNSVKFQLTNHKLPLSDVYYLN